MKLQIAGGCGEYGRNCFLIEGNSVSFLVDCGTLVGNLAGKYPKLSKEQIKQCNYLFLTHSHADHTGAIRWLCEQGYNGEIIASRHTFAQLPFHVEKAVVLERICPIGEGDYKEFHIRWGRSGHCMGSVWYRFFVEGKTIVFSGDYMEDTLCYHCDPIRGQKADLAVLDCAYGADQTKYEEYCKRLLGRVKELQIRHKLLYFPVPKYGRGIELARLFQKNGIEAGYYGDEHFLSQIKRIPSLSDWYKNGSCELLERIQPYESGIGEGIVFISEPQLRRVKARNLADEITGRNGIGIMTGTLERGTYCDQLLQKNQMKYICYPVHSNLLQYMRLVTKNKFNVTIPYHSVDFTSEPEAYF